MVRTGVLSDDMWARVEPVLPSSDGRQGRLFRDHRQVIEGVIYRLRTGVPCRDLPEEFGPRQTGCGSGTPGSAGMAPGIGC